MPNDREISIMEYFIQVMKPMVDITEALGAQKWITISTVRALLHKLLNAFLQQAHSDSKLIKMMKTKWKTTLLIATLDQSWIFFKAAFLHPRFKSLNFLSETERQEVTSKVEEEAASLPDDTEDQSLERLPPAETSRHSSGEPYALLYPKFSPTSIDSSHHYSLKKKSSTPPREQLKMIFSCLSTPWAFCRWHKS